MIKFILRLIAVLSLMSCGVIDVHAEWVSMEITAYTHTGNPTASGEWPYVGGIAFNDVPLGTRVMIDDIWYVVNDRSGAIGIIDLFMDTYDECIEFGRQYKQVYIER